MVTSIIRIFAIVYIESVKPRFFFVTWRFRHLSVRRLTGKSRLFFTFKWFAKINKKIWKILFNKESVKVEQSFAFKWRWCASHRGRTTPTGAFFAPFQLVRCDPWLDNSSFFSVSSLFRINVVIFINIERSTVLTH